jgi:hypothetical protein
MSRFKNFLVVWFGLFIVIPLIGSLLIYICCCFVRLEIIYPSIPFIFLRVYLCISSFLAFFISKYK